MAKKVSNLKDSNKGFLPRREKQNYLWDNQHDEPDTEIIGVIAVSQEAKQNVGGFLHQEANFYPSSHHKDARFITEKDGSVNPEIQAQLAWLGAQILGMSQLEITGSEALGAAFNLEVLNPSPGVYQIQLTYPAIVDADPTIVRSNPAGFGNMQQSIDGAAYADIANSDFVRRDGAYPMIGGLEIEGATDEIKLSIKSVGSPYQTNKLIVFKDSANVERAWVNPRGDMVLNAGSDSFALKVNAGWIGLDNLNRILFKDSGGTYRNAIRALSGQLALFSMGAGIAWYNLAGLGMATFNESGTFAIQNLTPTTGVTQLALAAGAGQSTNFLVNITNFSSHQLFKIESDGQSNHIVSDATTASTPDNLTLDHQSSGTPAANFGSAMRFKGKSSTTNAQNMARLRAVWEEATHATRKAQVVLSAYDTAEREILRGGTDGTKPTLSVLGKSPGSPVIDIGAIDCEGHLGAFAALDALKNFGFITGTVTLGEPPEPEAPPAELLNRCQIAQMLPFWIYNHVAAFAIREATYADVFYDVGQRTDAIKKVLDVFVPDSGALLGWVNDEWTQIGVEPDETAILFRLIDMRDYITSESVQTKFYCALDEFGRIDSVGYLGLLALLEADAGASDPATSFYNFMRAFDADTIAVWTAQGSYSPYVDLDADCTTFDCDNWLQSMDFTIDNWADSTDLVVGNYNTSKGYWNEDGGVMRLEIPYHIIYGSFEVCGSEEGLIPNEIRVQNLDTSAWTTIEAFIDCKTYEFEFDAPTGVAIEITAPSGAGLESQLHNIFLAGLGVQPMPD